MLGKHQAVAGGQAVHWQRVMQLVRELSQQVQLVWLADIAAADSGDALAQVGLGAPHFGDKAPASCGGIW